MVVYEVNLEVDHDARDAIARWLPGHIEEVVALPGFVTAEWLEVAGGSDDGPGRWSIRYALVDEAALERYLAEDAERMRRDGRERFGGRFTASRRVLRPLMQFAPSDSSVAGRGR